MRHTLWQSFRFAGRGLHEAFRTQRAMRVHVALAVAVALGAFWLDLAPAEAAALVLATAGVLAAELANTALEVLVDLHVGGRHHALAGRAKDLSAAAVLIASGGAAIVGLLVLGRPVVAALAPGRLDATAIGRTAVLAVLLALVVVVMLRAGERGNGAGGADEQ
jgi:diacylglycerol kinase